MNNRNILIGAAVVIASIFLGWLFVESSKPLPGQKSSDDGREHIDIGTAVEYKTNPPTSGKHYVDWIKPGVYPEPKDDRNLVHSLEHGYVIISYNCDKLVTSHWSLITSVSAHGLEVEEIGADSTEATGTSQLSQNFSSEDCHKLVDQLISVYEKKDKKKLLVIPRPNMDSRIALTAWNYLDKFDPSLGLGLGDSDITRIENFIDAHLDQGPEQTMEAPGT